MLRNLRIALVILNKFLIENFFIGIFSFAFGVVRENRSALLKQKNSNKELSFFGVEL